MCCAAKLINLKYLSSFTVKLKARDLLWMEFQHLSSLMLKCRNLSSFMSFAYKYLQNLDVGVRSSVCFCSTPSETSQLKYFDVNSQLAARNSYHGWKILASSKLFLISRIPAGIPSPKAGRFHFIFILTILGLMSVRFGFLICINSWIRNGLLSRMTVVRPKKGCWWMCLDLCRAPTITNKRNFPKNVNDVFLAQQALGFAFNFDFISISAVDKHKQNQKCFLKIQNCQWTAQQRSSTIETASP